MHAGDAQRSIDQVTADMTACRIERFGGPEVLLLKQLPRPAPGPGQILVRVMAAGVGPWDALIRAGQSALIPESLLPLTLGSELAGIVEATGDAVDSLKPGDPVYGATNGLFIGAYAQFALAQANKMAITPTRTNFIDAASIPIVAVTASQMLFTHAQVRAGQTVLVLGGRGSVGACAIQLARHHQIRVIAAASRSSGADLLRLGADAVIDLSDCGPAASAVQVDAVIDAVGGALQTAAWPLLKRGGSFVSAVSSPDPRLAKSTAVRSIFFYVDVGTSDLNAIAALLDVGVLTARVGAVLPLHEARAAHEMLAGARPRPSGKIVLSVAH